MGNRSGNRGTWMPHNSAPLRQTIDRTKSPFVYAGDYASAQEPSSDDVVSRVLSS